MSVQNNHTLSPDAGARLTAARAMATEAGALLRSYLEVRPEGRLKGEVDLVTEADQRSEALILEVIEARFPKDAVLAEESGGVLNDECEWNWVIDPLDGTTNFVHGLDHFAVSIGVLCRGVPTLGVIGIPARDEVYWAARGQGAWGPRGRLRVTEEEALGSALVATGFPYDRRELADSLASTVREALTRARGVRRMGAAALDLLGVARGQFGGYWERGISAWDVAAGLVMVEEAGGTVTDHDGQAITDLQAGRFLASNGPLHPQLLSMIQDSK